LAVSPIGFGFDLIRDRFPVGKRRFTAQECFDRPAEVMAEFLGMF
jgi:hypothetical protein